MLSGWAAFWIMIGIIGVAELFGRYWYKSKRADAVAMIKVARINALHYDVVESLRASIASLEMALANKEKRGGCSDKGKSVRKVR